MKNFEQKLAELGINPEENSEYFYIDERGKIQVSHWSIFNDEWDLKRLKNGNVFKTRKNAFAFIKEKFPKI